MLRIPFKVTAAVAQRLLINQNKVLVVVVVTEAILAFKRWMRYNFLNALFLLRPVTFEFRDKLCATYHYEYQANHQIPN